MEHKGIFGGFVSRIKADIGRVLTKEQQQKIDDLKEYNEELDRGETYKTDIGYISERIGDEYKQWQGRCVEDHIEKDAVSRNVWWDSCDDEGDYIFINAGTGTGKTYFVFNILAPYVAETGDKILYLCNRVTLKTDAARLKDSLNVDNIDIETYQKTQNVILRSRKTMEDDGSETDRYKSDYLKLWSYKYIVADEMHYFLEDSGMNKNIFFLYRFFLQRSPQIKILISATGNYARLQFIDKIKAFTYSVPSDKSYIRMHFFKDKRSEGIDFPVQKIKKIIEEETDSKIIYFVDAKKRIDKIWEENEDLREYISCMFSESQEDAHSIRDNECIKSMGDDIVSFDNRILLTTSILSNGVSLKDSRIKYIICDIKDVLTVTQCIGRKRPKDSDDICDVYVQYHYMQEFKQQKIIAFNKYNAARTLTNNKTSYCSEFGDFCSEDLSDCYLIDWLNDGIIEANWPRMEYYYQQMKIIDKIEKYEKETTRSDCKPAYGYRKALGYYSGISDISDVIESQSLEDPFWEEMMGYIQQFSSFSYPAASNEVKKVKDICKKFNRTQKELPSFLSENGYEFKKNKVGRSKITIWSIQKKEN